LSLPSLTRRNFFKASAVAAAAALISDAAVFEPDYPRLVRIEIALPRLPAAWDGLQIAQLSDFHYESRHSAVPIRKAVDMVNQLRPDLAVLTGDFVTVPMGANKLAAKRAAAAIEPCASLLGQIRSRLGSFAVLGNHDAQADPGRIVGFLKSQGIPVLLNRSIALEQTGSRLWLAGIDDALRGRPDLTASLRGIPSGEPVVLLAHEPDVAVEVARFPVDLQLSGHSHGGQVRLPLIGAPVLPRLGREFPWGLHRLENLALYTNAGIGTVRLPIRFNCPPEVTLITLRSASKEK
jgi:uncharacterized protein